MGILVKEIMSKPVVTIDYKKSAKIAANKMKEKRKGFLVVTKKDKPIGTLSDSDLINKIVARGKEATKIKVEKIMSSPMVTVSPNDEVMETVNKMKKNNVHRLPVVSRGKVVGVISLTDIARSSPEMAYLLEYRQAMKRRPLILKEETTSGMCDSCGNFSDELKKTQSNTWFCETCRDEFESDY